MADFNEDTPVLIDLLPLPLCGAANDEIMTTFHFKAGTLEKIQFEKIEY
ncbi:hypothetical protein [Eoetvoesiella caeni]